MSNKNKFHEFKNANKIWAVGSLHSNVQSFKSIRAYVFSNFKKDDKLIFLGNIIGFNNKSKEIINDVLSLRFDLMAKFKLSNQDFDSGEESIKTIDRCIKKVIAISKDSYTNLF